MQNRNNIGRYVVYACLGFGTILFAFPLLWMVITSLMPIEQAMAYPPNFIPKAHFVVIDGERLEVTKDFQIAVPCDANVHLMLVLLLVLSQVESLAHELVLC
ncbi:MAG: hypothetical protein ACREIA_09030 [Opitutaceae bacterium]